MPVYNIPEIIVPHVSALNEYIAKTGLAADHPMVMLCRILQMQIVTLSHCVDTHEKQMPFDGVRFAARSFVTSDDELTVIPDPFEGLERPV